VAEFTQNIVSYARKPTASSGATSLAEVERGDFEMDVPRIQNGRYLRNQSHRPLTREDAFAEQSWLPKS